MTTTYATIEAALRRIAFETFGPADSSADDVLDEITAFARVTLEDNALPPIADLRDRPADAMETAPSHWHVRVHGAQPIGPIGTQARPTLCLDVDEPFPDFGADYVVKARELHDYNGRQVAAALIGTLPGGTLDSLLVHLLTYKASLLAVRADRRESDRRKP